MLGSVETPSLNPMYNGCDLTQAEWYRLNVSLGTRDRKTVAAIATGAIGGLNVPKVHHMRFG